jgi:hypothetical protein
MSIHNWDKCGCFNLASSGNQLSHFDSSSEWFLELRSVFNGIQHLPDFGGFCQEDLLNFTTSYTILIDPKN